MNDLIEKAIKVLTQKIELKVNISPDEALKYSQSALNLMHVLSLYKNLPHA